MGTGLVVFANRAAIAERLQDWQLTPQPERLTELYFTDHTKLPKTLKAGANETVAFTVRNLEHQKITYHYKLVAMLDNSEVEKVLADGTFALDHDGTHLGNADIVVPNLGPQISIQLHVYYTSKDSAIQTQSIDYWVKVQP